MKAKPKQIHGLRRLKDAIRARGMGALDHRTGAVKDLMAFRSELVNALGGKENVSPQRMALIEMITRTRLYIDHVDSFLLCQSSLINRRRKSILPIVRERQSLVDSLERLLSRIGLDRVPAPVPTLQEYLESKEFEEAKAAQQDDAVHDDDAPADEGEPKT